MISMHLAQCMSGFDVYKPIKGVHMIHHFHADRRYHHGNDMHVSDVAYYGVITFITMIIVFIYVNDNSHDLK